MDIDAFYTPAQIPPPSIFSRALVAVSRHWLQVLLLQLSWAGPLSWLSPPPIGRMLAIAMYWLMLSLLLFYETLDGRVFGLEKMGFRAAWVGYAQVPLIFLLVGRLNAFGILYGVSYERLNWAHRWVSHSVLVVLTLHGASFLAEWIPSNFFWTEMKIMPAVKYGIFAWAVFAWTAVVSLLPLRRLSYRLFLLQHVLAAMAFPVLVWLHVPRHHRFTANMALTALGADVISRLGYGLYRNAPGLGFIGTATATEDGEVVLLHVSGARFKWLPGQHVYIWAPKFPWHFMHPFTIANCCCQEEVNTPTQHLQFIVRTKAGLTKSLSRFAHGEDDPTGPSTTAKPSLRLFLLGPYGKPPPWPWSLDRTRGRFDTAVFISTSTGASFTFPILESLLYKYEKEPFAPRVYALMLARQRSHVGVYLDRVVRLRDAAARRGIPLEFAVALTSGRRRHSGLGDLGEMAADDAFADDVQRLIQQGDRVSEVLRHCSSPWAIDDDEMTLFAVCDDYEEGDIELGRHVATTEPETKGATTPTYESSPSTVMGLQVTAGRPDLEHYLRTAASQATGNVWVVACGGKEIATGVRIAVRKQNMARLPPGCEISLFIEEFGS